MVERKKIKTTAGFLLAEIDYVLNIHKGGQQEVCLKIASENRTNKTILLDENYYIPLSEAWNIKARDLNNDEPLFAFENKENERIEVVFKEGTRLPPGQKFSWTVTWNTSRFETLKTAEQWITGGFTVTPGEAYKGIPIQNHRVNLKVVFKRPLDGESYQSLTVDESTSLRIRAQKEEGKDEVAFTYDSFDLGKGGKLRATFVYKYESAVPGGNTDQKPTLRKRCSDLVFSTIPQTVSLAVPPVVTTVVKELLALVVSKLKF